MLRRRDAQARTLLFAGVPIVVFVVVFAVSFAHFRSSGKDSSPYSEEVRLAEGRGPVDETFPVSLDPGDYLMQVDARGPWRLAFGG